jgi:hypothetical protein
LKKSRRLGLSEINLEKLAPNSINVQSMTYLSRLAMATFQLDESLIISPSTSSKMKKSI